MKCDGCYLDKECNPYYVYGSSFFYCDYCAKALKVDLWTEQKVLNNIVVCVSL